jgi:ribose-phosphate pyrophosphokinase
LTKETPEVKKHTVLHPGGIAVVSTPKMAYMAKAVHEKLLEAFHERSVSYCEISYDRFSREEVLPIIGGNVRAKHVYLFSDFNGGAAHDSFVLLLTLSALQDAGAEKITIVVPYLPFLRQDRKDRSRVPISAKVLIQMMTSFDSVRHVITIDMHSEQIEAAFPRAPDHLPGYVVFEPWIRNAFGHQLDDVIIVGPDAGSEKRVERLASRVGCQRAFLTKKRDGATVAMREVYGAPVMGKICVINDDILDTCGTVTTAAQALYSAGAKKVYLTGTHAVFGGDAYSRLEDSGCQVVVTDSLTTLQKEWLTVLPLAPYLGAAILQNNIEGGSISHIIHHGI